ncbi:preprotein translocase subunit TatB [Haemophilus paracuniculus]|uniref:Preprotein translocase subunit TatB n=1 Tax=Haemophilus paracuniculus TaxID=734 RepID=A0A1T0AQQ8_9PAST|nr:sulfurtransferase TusA family protein [Haemophilus paracuniculus]OOR98596.1 preprotein translocase subunit TatB [Haemophilus paracuniculus]
MKYQLDLTAYRCPLPLLMAKKVLATLTAGAAVELVLNQATSLSDFKLLCEQQGYQWESCHQEAERYILTLKIR